MYLLQPIAVEYDRDRPYTTNMSCEYSSASEFKSFKSEALKGFAFVSVVLYKEFTSPRELFSAEMLVCSLRRDCRIT
jgi:hypothetical protein